MTHRCELTRYVPATCQRCGESYQQEQAAWAVYNTTGQRASGYTGRDGCWYGQAGPTKPWLADEFHLQWSNVYSPGGPYDMCDDCTVVQLHARERLRELQSDCQPDWFDPSYAGEQWNEDE